MEGKDTRKGSSGKRNPSCVYDPSEGLMWDMDSLFRVFGRPAAQCSLSPLSVGYDSGEIVG